MKLKMHSILNLNYVYSIFEACSCDKCYEKWSVLSDLHSLVFKSKRSSNPSTKTIAFTKISLWKRNRHTISLWFRYIGQQSSIVCEWRRKIFRILFKRVCKVVHTTRIGVLVSTSKYRIYTRRLENSFLCSTQTCRSSFRHYFKTIFIVWNAVWNESCFIRQYQLANENDRSRNHSLFIYKIKTTFENPNVKKFIFFLKKN